jgi:hypothetical protein
MVSGVMLFVAERYRRRAEVHALALRWGVMRGTAVETYKRLRVWPVGWIRATRGCAFLLAIRIILLPASSSPHLTRQPGRRAARAGCLACRVGAVAAVFTVLFPVGYVRTRTLTPFALYCFLFGVAMVMYTPR